MTEKRQRPQDRWNKKNGLISKSYKLNKDIVEEFAIACEKTSTSQKAQLEKMMKNFIEETKKEDQGNLGK